MRRMRTLPLPRYVEAASIDEGDTIRVTWKVLDVEHSRTAKVGRVIDEGPYKLIVSPEGQEIARFDRQAKLRFTLLAEAPARNPEPLFEMEKA